MSRFYTEVREIFKENSMPTHCFLSEMKDLKFYHICGTLTEIQRFLKCYETNILALITQFQFESKIIM